MQGDTVEISVSVPVELADADTAERARRLLVLDAVRSDRLSWREAARILGLSLDEFLDVAVAHGVPVQRLDVDVVEQDLDTLRAIARHRRDA